MDIDVNDLYTAMYDPVDEIGAAIFGKDGSGRFSDEEGYVPPSTNGGIRDDIDGLDMPLYFDEDSGEERVTEFEDLSNEWDKIEDDNADVSDLTKNYGDSEDGVQEFNGDFLKIGENQFEREVVENAVMAYSDMEARQNQLLEHIDGLDKTQADLDEFYGIAVLDMDENIFAYQQALDSGRLSPTQYQEYSLALKQLERNKAVITDKYKANLRNIEADKARAEKIAFKDTVNTLKFKHKWQDKDFNDAMGYINSNGIRVKMADVSPELFMTIRKAMMFDRKDGEYKKEAQTRVQKAVSGKPVRETKVPSRNYESDLRAKAARALAEGRLDQEDMFKFLVD